MTSETIKRLIFTVGILPVTCSINSCGIAAKASRTESRTEPVKDQSAKDGEARGALPEKDGTNEPPSQSNATIGIAEFERLGNAQTDFVDVIVDRGKIYAATSDGLLVSTDNGKTFSSHLSNLPGKSFAVSAILIEGDTMIVGGENFVAVSKDSGNNFRITKLDGAWKPIYDKAAPTISNLVYFNDRRIYAGSTDGFVVSDDDGLTFRTIMRLEFENSISASVGSLEDTINLKKFGSDLYLLNWTGVFSLPGNFDLANIDSNDPNVAIKPKKVRLMPNMAAFEFLDSKLITYSKGFPRSVEIGDNASASTLVSNFPSGSSAPRWGGRNVMATQGKQIFLGVKEGYTGTIYVSEDEGKTFRETGYSEKQDDSTFRQMRIFDSKLYVVSSSGLWRSK